MTKASNSQKTFRSVQISKGATGWKKFIPKNPERNETGMKSVVITAKTFMTEFMRLLNTER